MFIKFDFSKGAILDPQFKKCWISTTSMSEYALLDSVRFELTSRYSNLMDGENVSRTRSQGNEEEEGATNKESGPTPTQRGGKRRESRQRKRMRLNSNLMNRKERPTIKDSQPAPSIDRSSH